MNVKTAYCLSKLGDDYSGGLVKYFVEAFEALGGTCVQDTFPVITSYSIHYTKLYDWSMISWAASVDTGEKKTSAPLFLALLM